MYGEKLAAARIQTTADLLAHCGTRVGRKKTAESTGVSEKLLLTWSNLADMMRISGIGPQLAEMLEVSQAKNLANATPAEKVVAGWIAAAKDTEPTISH